MCLPGHKGSNILFLVVLLIFFSSLASADRADYLYDGAGRLLRVINGNNRALYNYDEVGNLLSVKRESSAPQASPPILESIDPDILFIGNSYQLTIIGQNLLSTSNITSDNPSITIKDFAAIDTAINATLSIAANAFPGQATVTVTTSYGTASISIKIYQVNINPGAMTLYDLSTAILAISLTPSASRDVTIPLKNGNPDIINTPRSAIIPAGSNVNVPIQTLKVGTATLGIENGEATVYVIGDTSSINANPVSVSFGVADNALVNSPGVNVIVGSLPDSALVSSPGVSVSVGCLPGNALVSSAAVTVGIGALPNSSGISSKPVSVGGLTALSETTISGQVSVRWPIQGATTVSMPVCVAIQHN